jgi:hypothetical protein
MTKEFHTTKVAAAMAVCAAAAGAAQAAEPAAPMNGPGGVVEAIQAGKPILDFRLRYAGVDQTGFSEDASALTLRTHLGWETGAYQGFKALVEFEDVRAIIEDYNSTANGKTSYPVEADPEVTELNRAQLSWTNGAGVTATGGRQRVILDNARFIGNVGWRQDEQTFDAARFDYAMGDFTVTYAYVWGVERIFAENADWGSQSHLLNASYTVSPALKLTGFVYALDLDEAPAASTTTTGVTASGATTFDEYKITYAGTYAAQSDYGDNPGDVDLDYYRVDLGASRGPLSLAGAYEVLEGDGTRGFSTPLATLHAFQGWADVFLTTPASGIEDAFVTAKYSPMWEAGFVSSPALTVIYHDFEAEQTGGDLGSEIDVQLTAKLAPKVSGVLKFADYDGPTGGPADRTKVWVGLQFTL